jgi:hypothetical protein
MRGRLLALVGVLGLTAASAVALPTASAQAGPTVLRVGSWHGVRGTFTSIQQAVLKAHSGDWVLVAPGDYKENGYQGASEPAGVLITTPGLHLRGMQRNQVIVDGTRPGSKPCSAGKADQVNTVHGRDGIIDFKVDKVSIENLTVCNYLTGTSGGEGNEIWFNGGDGSGKIGMGPFSGDYITATSTYSNGVQNPRGEYGIFTSNSRGPGTIDHSFASNMGDSAYYIGACPDCHQVLVHAHGVDSALGYSGTNSGGHLVIEDSEFDHNKTGATTNSQNNDDAPSPQNGACPGTEKGPLGIGICNVWMRNSFHDNNNPNVPGAGAGGLAGGAPVGTGLVFAGTLNVASYKNSFVNNGAWGIVVTDLPDAESPPTDIGQNCQGGTYVVPPGVPGQDPVCYFPANGNAVLGNTFAGNGGDGNVTNADIALFHAVTFDPPGAHGNCFSGNTDSAGLTSEPQQVESLPNYSDCNTRPVNPGNPNPVLAAQLNCAGGVLADCPNTPVDDYPRTTAVSIRMAPAQVTMPNPCAGVPVNPWCPAAGSGTGAGAGTPITQPLPRTGLIGTTAALGLLLLALGALTRRRLQQHRPR